MHTTRNIFESENFNMNNTEFAFNSFIQFGYLLLHIGSDGAAAEVFVFFPCTWRIKLLNNSKTKAFFWQFQITFHIYLDIGRDNDDDYDDGESNGKDYYQ